MIRSNIKWAMFILSIFAVTACNEDFPNLLKDEYPEDLIGQGKEAKVLYVIADGLRGEKLKELSPSQVPSITEMNENAIYSYHSLVDYDVEDINNAVGWTTLMTGVGSSKHGVFTDDFSNHKLDQYPTFISRIKSVRPTLRTAVFGSSANFIANLANDATEKGTFSSDEETKTATLAELANKDAAIVVTQFNNLDRAHSEEAYTQALEQLDAYLGELKKGLEGRESYALENWLVVISSGKGEIDETANDVLAFEDASRNTFTLLYNPKFQKNIIPKPLKIPYSGNTIKFSRTSASAYSMAVMDDASKFDIKSDKNYTLQFKYKNSGETSYPVIIGKQDAPETNGTGSGWNIFLSGNEWVMWLKGNEKISGGAVNDGVWHTISVVFNNTDKKVYLYTDGVLKNSLDMNTAVNHYSTNAPFRIGSTEGGARLDYNIADIQFYDVALSDAEIALSACKVNIDTRDPFFDKLAGYWPATDGRGNRLEDATGNGNDFNLIGDYVWEGFNDLTDNVCAPMNARAYEMVPNSRDLPFQIYQWLSISVPENWGLDGKAWTPSYTQIRP